MVFKALNGEAPSYLTDLLEVYNPKRTLRSLSSRDPLTLVVPKTNPKLQTYGDFAFSVAGPKMWNTLPFELRSSPSTAMFKRNLKTYLFSKTYD